MQQQSALELIVLRNEFYRDGYKKALLALVLMILINALLGWAIYYKVTHLPEPEYFAVNDEGRMIPLHGLAVPAVSDEQVYQFAGEVVRRTFTMDYLHWKEQMQRSVGDFTESGWASFATSLKNSNNMQTLLNLKMVSSVEITGAPELINKSVINGRYAWQLRMPIAITLTNGNKVIPQTMMVTLIVVRVPITESSREIAVDSFVADSQSRVVSSVADEFTN